MTARRGVLAIAGLLVVVLISVAGFATWLLITEAGARYVVAQLVEATGSILTADRVSGTLAGRVEFGNLRFSIDRVVAEAESATAELELSALLQRRLVIRDLYVSTVTVVPRPADAPVAEDAAASEPFEAVDLPVAVVLESVAVAGIDLSVNEIDYEFGQLTMTLSYDDRIVDVARFDSTYQNFSLSTQAKIDLAAGPAVDATLSLAGRYSGYDVLLGGTMRGTLPEVEVEAELLEPTRVDARGQVVLNAGPSFDLELAWEAVTARLLAALPVDGVEINAGSGRVTGLPTAFAFDGTTGVTMTDAQIGMAVSGRYSTEAITLERARLTRDDATLDVTGAFDLETADFRFSLSGGQLNPAWYVPGWEGRIGLVTDLTGSAGRAWRVASERLTVTGVVRDQPFTATAAAAYSADGDLQLDQGRLEFGRNTLTADGRIGAGVALAVEADLEDLGDLLDGVAGSLTASFDVDGSLSAPIIDGSVAVTDLEVANVSVARIEANGQIGVAADVAIDMDVNATRIEIAGIPLDAVSGDIAGSAGNHTARFAVSGSDWQSAFSLDGSLVDILNWTGRLTAARYEQSPFGEWLLREPAGLAVSPSRVELERACVGQGGAELCLGGTYGADEDGDVQVSATDFDLRLLRPILPEGITATGRYQLAVDIRGPRTSPLGTFLVDGGETQIIYARTAEDSVTAQFERVHAEGLIELDRLQSMAEIVGVGDDRLSFTLIGNRTPGNTIALDGRVDANWADIAPLTVLSRSVGDVAGSVAAAIEIGGTLDSPRFDGRADLHAGRLDLPIWGVVTESIEGTARSTNGESITFEATGNIDGSVLNLTGTTELTAVTGWPTRLTLSGDRVPLVQVADADIVVSPQLQIDVDLPRVNVAGTVVVPEGLISIDALPEQAVRPSNDTVLHGVEVAERTSPLLLSADIDLRLGDDVRYEGAGLLADLGGDLRLRYSSETSTDASGTLSVTGTYEAFGQELTLERGELVFTGPLENPTLNVRAVRRVEDITVGIDLTGTLEAPVSRIFSEPVMAEADAVSYLLFGRPLAAPDSGGDPDQLRNAAVALGLRQAVPVIQRIGDSLGFDEFAIESTNVDAGELMAGKYLSPKLFIRYSYGLFNRIGGLLLQYRLNDRISIETRSGDQKSMDLLYTVEKD